MEEINNLAHGFAVALTLPNLLYMLVGITLGVLIGVLPGLGGANGVAILLPLTFTMSPTSAIYIAVFMIVLGKYAAWKSVLIGVLVSAAFFAMFEVWFKVPLYKGSLDLLAFLGY